MRGMSQDFDGQFALFDQDGKGFVTGSEVT